MPMTGLNVARVAKLIALFGFLLPWVLVSCAGEPIGRLTGLELATGVMIEHSGGAPPQAQRLHPDLWVALSLAAVIVGLALSFLVRGRQALLAVGAAAIVALAASAIGVASESSVGETAASRSQALGRVDLQYGYLVTVAGLVAAICACGVSLAQPSGRITSK
jgi:hypothetical protein